MRCSKTIATRYILFLNSFTELKKQIYSHYNHHHNYFFQDTDLTLLTHRWWWGGGGGGGWRGGAEKLCGKEEVRAYLVNYLQSFRGDLKQKTIKSTNLSLATFSWAADRHVLVSDMKPTLQVPSTDGVNEDWKRVSLGNTLHCQLKQYTHGQTHTHTCAHKDMHTHIHTHVCTQRHAHTHVCTQRKIHTHTHTCAHTKTCTHTYTHTCVHTHTHTHVCTQRHAHTHTYTCVHTKTCTHTHTCVHTKTCTHTHVCTQRHAHTHTHTCVHKERYTHWDKTDPERDADKAPSDSRCGPPHLNVLVLVEGATGAEELAELTARHQGHQQVGSSWGQHQSNIITNDPHHAPLHPLTPYLHTLYNPSHTHSPLTCTPCTIPLTPTHPLPAHPVQSLSHSFTPYLHTLYNPSHTHLPLICTPCTIPLTPIHPLSAHPVWSHLHPVQPQPNTS